MAEKVLVEACCRLLENCLICCWRWSWRRRTVPDQSL